jgi:hypothetical protein
MARRRFVAVPATTTTLWVDPAQVSLVRETESGTQIVLNSGFTFDSNVSVEAVLSALEIAHGEAEFHFAQQVDTP